MAVVIHDEKCLKCGHPRAVHALVPTPYGIHARPEGWTRDDLEFRASICVECGAMQLALTDGALATLKRVIASQGAVNVE